MFENNNDDLRAALRRVEPPAGFENRVLARLHENTAPRRLAGSYSVAAWLSVAAMAMLSVGGVTAYQQQREQQRAIAARDQLLLALQITGKTLDSVREQINQK